VIYNGVAGPARTLAPSSAEAPRIGCVGRIAPEKGHREFVAAAARIHQALPHCRFAIYGAPLFADAAAEGYMARLRRDGAGLPLDFAGWVDDNPACMAQLDLLLVPFGAPRGHDAGHPGGFCRRCAGHRVPFRRHSRGGGRRSHRPVGAHQRGHGAACPGTAHRRPTAPDFHRAARESWTRRFTLERYHHQILRAIEAAAA
jgi:hypothetical protein